jgi:uridine kinase
VIRPRPIVIAAGFLALHDEEVNRLFDTTAFIDLPEAEILRRRRERANPENPWDKPGYIAESLVAGTRKHVLPQRERAEHILDGMKSQHELVEDALKIIRHAGLW